MWARRPEDDQSGQGPRRLGEGKTKETALRGPQEAKPEGFQQMGAAGFEKSLWGLLGTT